MSDARIELELKIKSEYLGDVWQNFCQLHSLLYELTCDEYVHLLSSDLDKLDDTLNNKQEVIAEINVSSLLKSYILSGTINIFCKIPIANIKIANFHATFQFVGILK